MSDKKSETPPTIITLTLPTPEGGGIAPERATATLLIQRGDLAHVQQFHYGGYLPDVMDAIRAATETLGALEDDPPVVPDLPADPPKPAPKAKAKPAALPTPDDEPTIDIPLKKGTLAVKISHLKIVGGESDAAAYRQAALIAGKLVDGKLWDGQSPIRLRDVYALAKRMQHLADRELSEQPSLSLNFYSFGITLRKQEGDRVTEYPIDPAQVAVALAARVTFDTGLLSGETLLVRQEGVRKTVVEYRKPQITGIFLDDAESALRVPLPGLVMIRKTGGQSAVTCAATCSLRVPFGLRMGSIAPSSTKVRRLIARVYSS